MTTVGLCLPQLGSLVTRKALRSFVEGADELGDGGLRVQEHLFHPHSPVSGSGGRAGLVAPDVYQTAP